MENDLKLKIVSPGGVDKEISCNSVRLTVCDGEKGNEGGSYGIHKGHEKAIFVLDKGEVSAYSDGKLVYKTKVSGGFAAVDLNVVTVLPD